MGRLPNAEGDHCNFDFDTAGRLVAAHLQQRGHTRVAFFNPKPGQVQFERIKSAFFAVARSHQIEPSLLEVDPPQELTWPLPAITIEDHVDILVERWTRLPKSSRPTALFTPSDRTAVQVYAALSRRELRVADDVSIISCNNERTLATSLHPTLTTVDVHAEEIGTRAIDLLLWRIAQTEPAHSLQVYVDPSLAERESVAKL
jgi:DNA-binding LacI/PurR family transcriptional regulator